MRPALNETEVDLWVGRPSLVSILPVIVGCTLFIWLLFPIPLLVYEWLRVRNTTYKLTSQRIIVESGIFGRKTEEVELFRVRDMEQTASLLERLCGVASLRTFSTDKTAPQLSFEGIGGAQRVKEAMRARVLTLRETRRRII